MEELPNSVGDVLAMAAKAVGDLQTIRKDSNEQMLAVRAHHNKHARPI
jgi:hypothetical protein